MHVCVCTCTRKCTCVRLVLLIWSLRQLSQTFLWSGSDIFPCVSESHVHVGRYNIVSTPLSVRIFIPTQKILSESFLNIVFFRCQNLIFVYTTVQVYTYVHVKVNVVYVCTRTCI